MSVSSQIADLYQPIMRRVRVLGKGSFGVVYLAETIDSHEQFAVKSADVGPAGKLLEKEKRIYEAFQGQPEILHCYIDMKPLEPNERIVNLVLEYAPAGTLEDLIRKSGQRSLPEKDVQFYVKTILSGLSCMHAKGYVHCDIKPENVLAFPSSEKKGPPYRVKLADFGLAKEPQEQIPRVSGLQNGKFRGTPPYMSPEAVEGIISPAMDVWAVGCSVVQLVAGLDFLWGDLKHLSLLQCLNLLVRSDLKPTIPDSMSETGKDFLRLCFERDHTKRWSAAALLNHPFVKGINSDEPRRRSSLSMCFFRRSSRTHCCGARKLSS